MLLIMEYLEVNPIARFKVALKEVDKVYLSEEELGKIEKKDFYINRLKE